MLLVVSVVGIYYFNFQSPAGGDLLSYKNESNKPHKLVLADGSIVTLKPHSSLEYPETFSAESREVHLYGEAFFQVKRNPQKPFSVYSEDIVTKVLGTSFNVQAFENKKDIVVSVKTGKVSVATKVEHKKQKEDPSEQLKGVLITRNQQITYSKKNRKITKQLVSEPVLRNAKPGAFTFEDKPVAEIFQKLERAYGIDIIFDREVMSQCRLTTKLDNTEFYDKLRLICKGLNAKYEILDAHVIISGEGCQ
ncbi:FecR family protein [Fulvivirga ligni]|uniref:FecR family protein n=1 Tax=Fulvivirga ligni TaxID=2904246 RepID=UPI001F366C64|nr:FecR family protein [Fulvivirga ligni]UII19626.1 FecR family protein [Fulvivirga ligni]